MLLAFGAKNFICFNEGIEVSFRLNKQTPKDISEGLNFTRLLGVKGANSSGKTNVLKIISFIAEFAKNSFLKEPDKNTGVITFFNNEKPTQFFIEFMVNNIEYRYELVLTNQQVISEKLFKKGKRKTRLFERKNNKLIYVVKALNNLKIIKLRNNASIISTSHQYTVNQILNNIYQFFKNIKTNIDKSGLRLFNPLNIDYLTKMFQTHPAYFHFAKKIILSCDMGIHDLFIEEYEKSDESKAYRVIFIHLVKGKKERLSFAAQSSGTKSLYKQLGHYKRILIKGGGILVLDEFDINLHPHILPHLLNLFLDKQNNPHNAQFLFTTHNTEILDFLGKYRTYLINKEDNESYAYRLDEIRGNILRNDRSIIPIYDSGKIGGIPKI